MDDLKKRLTAVEDKRDQAASKRERVQGRLDSARKTVADVEQEILARGVEPDKLDATILAVQQKADKLVKDLETRIATTTKALEPFLGDELL